LSPFSPNPKETPKELFGREKELDEIIRLVKAKRWIALLGLRMVGKTSLIKTANKKLENAGIKAVYVNLWSAKRTLGLMKALAIDRDVDEIKREKGLVGDLYFVLKADSYAGT
jgi:AAA+ ATPase superfamily predicted ATPase